ncbi:1,5-anhydro-D-fructose reductase [Cryptotermes secundus]|uniref:1,5-anhydro-D-fructose reductase n=1 Tax=Cryptotermes secundus TaxID=105785 RepID=A0A2J7Q6Z4_9NEOP|nr:1,5-anhydro-D-fructose reductase [Cryptotermes secundus]PNF24350.1 1,5-anhydro-D-fructose reductase [Cryptotermes secundus]
MCCVIGGTNRSSEVYREPRRLPAVLTMMSVKLNNNRDIPVLGVGTLFAKQGEAEQLVKDAIDIGYRHFDTAMAYQNEKEVGAGVRAKIAEGVIKREDIFITSKLWNTKHKRELVVDACKETVSKLGLEYVDLYLIHWPFAFKDSEELWPKDSDGKVQLADDDYVDTWKGMEECVKLGLARSVGISNFNTEQINRVLEVATIKPAVNQVECHPYLNQSKLIAFCKERGIVITAYCPLGSPNSIAKADFPAPLKDPTLQELASKYKKSVAQIILRYLIQHGTVPIPKSSNKNRLKENFDIFDFELSSADVAAIDALDRNARICAFNDGIGHKNYPFDIEY